MKKVLTGLLMVLGAVWLTGCVSSSAGNAAPTQGGEKIHIDVLCDRGDAASMEAKQWRYRNEVGAYMEPNLVRRLQGYKFSSALIQNKSEFKKEPNRYLLKVKITAYNPGSAAARMMVGYGAGACSLDCSYELVDSTGKQVLAWTDGIGTSADWRRLPVSLNKKAGKKLSDHFKK